MPATRGSSTLALGGVACATPERSQVTTSAGARLDMAEGVEPLTISIEGDEAPAAFVPDKGGKPRQPQLGCERQG